MSGHRGRYREIAAILSRHRMGHLVWILGLERRVALQRGPFGHRHRDTPYTRPEHVRLALEELGATFVKLGQILSTRPDLLPPEYLVELAKLQDAAPPLTGAAVRELIAQEFRRDLVQAFASFEVDPLAAASIGQGHAAMLHDGTGVVVKVRRPGVVEQVDEDLEILQNLAAHADRSRPSRPLLATTIAVVLIGLAIPYLSLAQTLGFRSLPWLVLVILIAMTVTYLMCAETGKFYFFRPTRTAPAARRQTPPPDTLEGSVVSLPTA